MRNKTNACFLSSNASHMYSEISLRSRSFPVARLTGLRPKLERPQDGNTTPVFYCVSDTIAHPSALSTTCSSLSFRVRYLSALFCAAVPMGSAITLSPVAAAATSAER